MNLPTWFVLLDIVAVVVLIARRVDVRLALLLGSIPLFAANGGMAEMLGKMAAEMANPATVVPIGSALGFAYVLRLTECDREMVRLLLRPLKRLPMLLIPGGVAAGYLVNTTIVSQSGTAAVLGPILIPVLLAGGLAPATAGAVLLLGSSMGGELFNPGAVEMRKLADLTGLGSEELVRRQAPLNFIACGTALLVFWILARRQRAARATDQDRPPIAEEKSQDESPINLFKAVVPIVPLVLLFVDTALAKVSPLASFEGPTKILSAILIGVILSGLAAPGAASRLAASFFEGAGYAYTHVISLIVTASTFAEGVRRSGLIELLVRGLANRPAVAPFATVLIPWGLGVVSGSGIAPAIAIMEFFVPAAESLGLDPVQLGALASLGAHFGRTMSPAAAVVAMSARLSDAPPGDLIRRVVVPLLVGMAVMLAASLLKVV